jgi:hypothetical protein
VISSWECSILRVDYCWNSFILITTVNFSVYSVEIKTEAMAYWYHFTVYDSGVYRFQCPWNLLKVQSNTLQFPENGWNLSSRCWLYCHNFLYVLLSLWWKITTFHRHMKVA